MSSDISLDNFVLASSAATVNHSGGVFRVQGTSTLQSGVFQLNGGTIEGGVLNISAGTLSFTTNSNNRLRGVTLNGDVSITTANARLRLADGLTMSGALTLSGSGTQITSENTQLVDGGTLWFDPTTSGTKTFSIASGATTTFGAVQRITGGRGMISGSGSLINNGLVSADTAGQALTVAPTNCINHAIMEARNGGSLTIGATGSTWSNAVGGSISAIGGSLSLAGNWTNQGTISVNGAALTLGGSFSTASIGGLSRTGGSVALTGQLENSGAELALNSLTGGWTLNGGRIHGGRLSASGGARLLLQSQNGNLLDGVEVGDALDFSTGGRVRATATTTFTAPLTVGGSGARLGLDVGRTLDNQMITLGGAGGTVRQLSAEGNGDLILGPNTLVQGRTARISSGLFVNSPDARVVNQGRIATNGIGTLEIGPANFRNEGIVEAASGGFLRLGWDGTQNTRWTNVGILRTGTNAILGMSGLFRTSDIGTIERTGGRVGAYGVLDNTGATLS